MFARPLFVCMRTNRLCLRLRYSCLYGRTARVCVYAVLAYADEEAVFACTLFMHMPMNSPSLGDAIRVYADEYPVFACTLFLRMRTNGYVCMNAIRADSFE